MKLSLVGKDNWFTIEKAEHEYKYGIGRNEYGMCMTWSGRISDADVEGDREEMLGIAEAIENRSGYSADRCAVEIQGDEAHFCSPRNSLKDGVVPLADADELAKEIRAKLAA